jgi:hypothetical protein
VRLRPSIRKFPLASRILEFAVDQSTIIRWSIEFIFQKCLKEEIGESSKVVTREKAGQTIMELPEIQRVGSSSMNLCQKNGSSLFQKSESLVLFQVQRQHAILDCFCYALHLFVSLVNLCNHPCHRSSYYCRRIEGFKYHRSLGAPSPFSLHKLSSSLVFP